MRDRAEAGVDDGSAAGAAVEVGHHLEELGHEGARRAASVHEGWYLPVE
jgi:hypothetical protein